jgi:hypothetical protein
VKNFPYGNPVHVISKAQQSNGGPGKSRVGWRELILNFAVEFEPDFALLDF